LIEMFKWLRILYICLSVLLVDRNRICLNANLGALDNDFDGLDELINEERFRW
jgi:hypothetical protein